jgi:peroxiredoxin
VLEGDETPVNWRAHMLAPVPRGRPFTITLLRDLHPADSPTTAGGGPIRVEHRLQFTANDGTFAVANVQPGDYFLHYDLCEVPNQIDETMLPPTFWTPERGSYSDPFPNNLFFDIPASVQGHVARVINAVPVKLLSYPVKIPTSSGADLTKTVELGDIRLHVPKRRRLGQAAPPLQGRREDGSLFELSALRGRWVLLVFGANEPGYPCTEEQLSALAKQRSDIAGDRKVEIVVLSLSTDAQALSKLRSGQKLPWPVVPVGPWAQSKAAADYNVIAVPEISLVNPDGRIAAVHLTGQKLLDVVDALELDKATALAKLQAAKTQLAEFQARYPGNNNHVHALDLQQRIQWLERQVEPEPGEESAAKR